MQLLKVALKVALLVSAMSISSHRTSHAQYYVERTVWDRFGGSELNISSFAFRDINRNGVYDMNDQPMAGAVFKLTGGGKAINRSTNKSGFGNLRASPR
jgi:hypothetical protein